ncbi:hypothetical protein YC2023_108508 [Brassica napus]
MEPLSNVLALRPKVVDIKAMRFMLLEVRSWQEAKSNSVTVALGKDDRIGRAQSQIIQCREVKFVTLTGLSLARHIALPNHVVGLDGQSCSFLIVGWPVGLSSPTLGVGRPSVMFLFDCWPVGRPMLRTELEFEIVESRTVRLLVRIAVRLNWMKPLKWREFKAKPKPQAKEEREIQRTGQWYGLDRWEETKLRWERTSSLVGKTKIEKMKEDDSVIIQVKRYEDDCGGLEEDTQGTVVDRVKRLWRQVENVVKTSNIAIR